MPVTRNIAAALFALTLFPSQAVAGDGNRVDLTPEIHGVIRTRYEGEWGEGHDWRQRFQVRNARVSVGGNALRQLSY